MVTDNDILELSVHEGRENWDMKLNLHELFFGIELSDMRDKDYKPDLDIIHYTRWGRIKKIIGILNKKAYCNEKSVKEFREWLIYQISVYKNFRDEYKAKSESCISGGSKNKAYKQKAKAYDKRVKLLEKALKEVQDGKV